MKTGRTWFALAILAGLYWVGHNFRASGGDDDLSFEKLPEPVREAVQKTFPNAEVVRVEREGGDNDRQYEISLKHKDGRKIEVEILPDGQIVEIDEQIQDLPADVIKSINKTFPNASIKHAKKETNIRVVYHVEVLSRGKRREVELSSRGKILEIERR